MQLQRLRDDGERFIVLVILVQRLGLVDEHIREILPELLALRVHPDGLLQLGNGGFPLTGVAEAHPVVVVRDRQLLARMGQARTTLNLLP